MATKKSSGAAAPTSSPNGGAATPPLPPNVALRLERLSLVIDDIAYKAEHIDRVLCWRVRGAIGEQAETVFETVRFIVQQIGAIADFASATLTDTETCKGGIEAWLLPPMFESVAAEYSEEPQHG